MTELSEETLGQFTLGDAYLRTIAWENDGKDLRLDLLTGAGRQASLRCCWATDVKISLTHESGIGGEPLSWGLEATRREQRWHLVFEFPPQGEIELVCNSATLETVE